MHWKCALWCLLSDCIFALCTVVGRGKDVNKEKKLRHAEEQ